jgi:hypothetical protein
MRASCVLLAGRASDTDLTSQTLKRDQSESDPGSSPGREHCQPQNGPSQQPHRHLLRRFNAAKPDVVHFVDATTGQQTGNFYVDPGLKVLRCASSIVVALARLAFLSYLHWLWYAGSQYVSELSLSRRSHAFAMAWSRRALSGSLKNRARNQHLSSVPLTLAHAL